MHYTDVFDWRHSTCNLRQSQITTLSVIVFSAIHTLRLTLAEIGRTMCVQRKIAAKHCIKRVDRFLGNEHIEPATAMEGWIRWLVASRKRLIVSMDWVDVRQWHCLVLAARFKGRALPMLWAAYSYDQIYRSQNNYEYALLHLLRSMVPASTEIIILADRGFGRAEMARTLHKMGFSYIIRIQPEVWIKHERFSGRLSQLPVKPGMQLMLRNVMYRKERPFRQHVAILWPGCSEQPWFLMTNLPKLQAGKLSKIYGHRMSIEEYFRDCKSKRNGFGLRFSMIKKDPRRLERLLLICAMAYWLLVAVGLYASHRYPPRCWSSSSSCQYSLFSIGRYMLATSLPPLMHLLKNLKKSVLNQNWG
jgi:hypothetical protein